MHFSEIYVIIKVLKNISFQCFSGAFKQHGRLAQLVAHPLDVREVTSSSLVSSTIKKVSFVYQTKETFLRDAFLAERDAHCVRDAASPVMHAFGACVERIASPITAQRHHLSLICKEGYFVIWFEKVRWIL